MKVFDRGFGHNHEIDIAGDAYNFKEAKPPTSKPCIDEARRYSGCDAAKRSRCPFFDNARGWKLPGCTLYSKMEYDPAYKPLRIARNLPPLDPKDLDGFSIEEAS